MACTDSGSPNSNPDPTVKSTNVTYKVKFRNAKNGKLEELKKVEEKDGKAYYQAPVGTMVVIDAIPDKNVKGEKFIWEYVWEHGKSEKRATEDFDIQEYADGRISYRVSPSSVESGTITIRALGFYEDEKGEKPVLINSNQQPCVIQRVEEETKKVKIKLNKPTYMPTTSELRFNVTITNTGTVKLSAGDLKQFKYKVEASDTKYNTTGVVPLGVLCMLPDKNSPYKQELTIKPFENAVPFSNLENANAKFTLWIEDSEGNVLGKVEKRFVKKRGG